MFCTKKHDSLICVFSRHMITEHDFFAFFYSCDIDMIWGYIKFVESVMSYFELISLIDLRSLMTELT